MSTEIPYLSSDATYHGLPDGWVMHVHPQGWVYFRNAEHRMVVDEDIRDPPIFEKLSACLARWQPQSLLPDDFELHVLSLVNLKYSLIINHTQHVAGFNLEKAILREPLHILSVPKSSRLRRLYWNYVQQHPVHVSVPKHAVVEARDALQALFLDHLIAGPRSLAPFSKAECQNLLDVLPSIEGSHDDHSPARTAFIAWLLKTIYNWRYETKVGTYTRRQLDEMSASRTAGSSITQENSRSQRLLSILINFPFFGIPKTYLAHTTKAGEFTGRLAGLQDAWQAYTRQLTREYSDFVLASTVLLSATISFLAVPDIAESTKALGIMSVFASLGSIISGIFFAWRHHRQLPSSHALAYIHNARTSILGLPGHALLLSLPPVFLVWSVLTFAAAVIVYTLQTPVNGAGTTVIIAFFAVMLFLLVIGLYTFSHIWTWKGKRASNIE